MCCLAAYVAEDRDEAYRSYVEARRRTTWCPTSSATTTRSRIPEHVPNWPDRIPEPTLADIPSYLEAGALLLGDPDDALQQAKMWESIGVDQLVFGVGPAPIEETGSHDRTARQVRDPQDRYRPGAPHDGLPPRGCFLIRTDDDLSQLRAI